jgi:thiol-disulfide isomerase/thioredoxin
MKTKNIIGLLFVLLLLGLTVFFLFNKIQQTQQKKEAYHSIPGFRIPDINGHIITESPLQEYRTIMFLYFNPDCDLCRDEMIQIKENEQALSQGKIIFFSESPADSIRQFLQTIDFEPLSNMLFLPDENAILINKMEVRGTPTVYIYREGQLFKRFDGPVKIETLIHYFTEK